MSLSGWKSSRKTEPNNASLRIAYLWQKSAIRWWSMCILPLSQHLVRQPARLLHAGAGLVGADPVLVLQGEADVVETVHQAMPAEFVDLERDRQAGLIRDT